MEQSSSKLIFFTDTDLFIFSSLLRADDLPKKRDYWPVSAFAIWWGFLQNRKEDKKIQNIIQLRKEWAYSWDADPRGMKIPKRAFISDWAPASDWLRGSFLLLRRGCRFLLLSIWATLWLTRPWWLPEFPYPNFSCLNHQQSRSIFACAQQPLLCQGQRERWMSDSCWRGGGCSSFS